MDTWGLFCEYNGAQEPLTSYLQVDIDDDKKHNIRSFPREIKCGSYCTPESKTGLPRYTHIHGQRVSGTYAFHPLPVLAARIRFLFLCCPEVKSSPAMAAGLASNGFRRLTS